jgi:LPPG:FO 2-phospho-L-lactate transferase
LITVIAGGTGSVKLVRGLAAITDDLTVISNVGDNIWLYGLYICPDIDTIVYGLADMLDEEKGWGIRGDSFHCLDHLRKGGAPGWFSLGDRDLATHLIRTAMLKEGQTLSQITDATRRRLGISARIIPSTDDPVATMITTNKGKMHLQEFWVKNRARPRVKAVTFEGSKSALPNRKALDAIAKADVVIIAPANPVSSIGPTLAIGEFRDQLQKRNDRVIAVSPIIGKSAISGPAVKYMKAIGLENTPIGVAKYYGECVGNYVISKSDSDLTPAIGRLGMNVFETDIMMRNKQAEIRLARYLVARSAQR